MSWLVLVFFFKQKTAYEMRISDWSSDVCSSDLIDRALERLEAGQAKRLLISGVARAVKPKELAAEYGRPHKLFDCCIALGFEAEDTRSNATEVASWVARRNYKTVRLRSEEQPSEIQSLMRISYAAFCLKKKITKYYRRTHH